jgi:hypothetical protein
MTEQVKARREKRMKELSAKEARKKNDHKDFHGLRLDKEEFISEITVICKSQNAEVYRVSLSQFFKVIHNYPQAIQILAFNIAKKLNAFQQKQLFMELKFTTKSELDVDMLIQKGSEFIDQKLFFDRYDYLLMPKEARLEDQRQTERARDYPSIKSEMNY